MPDPVPFARDVHGVNYIPGHSAKGAKNCVHNYFLLDSVNGSFDINFVREELDYLQSLGVRYIRLFRSFWDYAKDRAAHLANLQLVAQEIFNRGMRVLLVMFDGVLASSHILNDLRREPWYDAIEGGGGWSFSATSIPQLTTLLKAVETQAETDYSSITPRWDGIPGGSWMQAPGGLYVLGYDHTSYSYPTRAPFSAEHTNFHEAMIDYVEDSLAVFDAISPVLVWAVDVFNEPDIFIASYAIILGSAWGPVEYPGLAALTQIQALQRVYAWLQWWEDYMRDQHPTRAITIGHVSSSDWAGVYAYGMRPDFWSAHNYSYTITDEANFVAGLRDAFAGITDVCLSEIWRIENNGQRGSTFPLYTLREKKIGTFLWELISTPGFLFNASTISNWGSIPPPSPIGMYYPSTGIAHFQGTTYPRTLHRPRQNDLEPILTAHFNGSLPSSGGKPYRVFLSGPQTLQILDRGGKPYPEKDATTVVWRWEVVTRPYRPDIEDSSFVAFPGIGKWMDGPNEVVKVGLGSTKLSSPVSLAGFSPYDWLVVSAVVGDTDYDPTDYNATAVDATIPIAATKAQYATGLIEMKLEARGRVAGGSADPGGTEIRDLAAEDPHRVRDFIVAPVHEPGWYVSDNAPETRAAGHKYTVPNRYVYSPQFDPHTATVDPNAWQTPGQGDLRQIKPPSGFPTLCYRLTAGAPVATEGLRLIVRGVTDDCRRAEEDVYIYFDGVVGESITWGEVPFREITEIEVKTNDLDPGTTDAVLTVGWFFEARPTDTGGNIFFDEPHEVGHNASAAITMTKAGDSGDSLTIWDGVNDPVTLVLGTDVTIGASAALTAANLKTAIDAEIGVTLGNWLSTNPVVGATVTLVNASPELTNHTVWTVPPMFMRGATDLSETTPGAWDSFSVVLTQATPQWKTGFPVELKRDDKLGYTKTRNVDGHIIMDMSAWHSHDRSDEAHVFGLPTSFGGGFGYPQHFRTPTFESGVFDEAWNTWSPPVFGRPRVSAGHDGGTPRGPVNQTCYQLYCFRINERRN